MTVETTARKQSFAGGQSSLEFSFRALTDAPSDIKVVVVTSGTETALTYGVDYSVTIATDGIGGVVVVSPSYSTDYTYTVYRETTNLQESDYDDYNQFPADTLENDLDRRTLIDQEQSEDLDRVLKVGISSSLSDLELPSPSAGEIIGWNGAADGLTNYPGASASITASSNYATTASAAAVLAGLYASTASTQATTASTQATLAGLYASTASTQAALAGLYATTASTAAATIPSPSSGNVADLLRVNATKTAYELFAAAALGVNVYAGAFSIDIATTNSTQVYTLGTLTFAPKALILLTNVNATSKTSFGLVASTSTISNNCIFDYQGEVANSWGTDSKAIFMAQSSGNYFQGVVTAMASGSFTMSWLKTGSTTGSAAVRYLAIG